MNWLTTNITQKLTQIFLDEFDRLILYLPFIFAVGVYCSFLTFENLNFIKITFAILLFIFSIIIYLKNKESFRCIIFIAFAAFLFGFLSTYFHQKIASNYNQITGKIYADVKGRVVEINEFKKGKKAGANLVIAKLTIYKHQQNNNNFSDNEPKISTAKIISNFMNVEGLTEIDQDFLSEKNKYQNVEWLEKEGHLIYPNPPKKISVLAQNYPRDLKIGDEIIFTVLIEPLKTKEIVGGFDYSSTALQKGIGASGNVKGEIEIIKKSEISSYKIYFENLRKKIQTIILTDIPSEEGNVIAALLMGNQNLISDMAMNNIRYSGLAHLISISGLHLSLAAGIFFFAIRFLFSLSEYLLLSFNIKKIAAFFAIISSYIYLEIAGSPVPAQRSFIAVLLVMLAIIIDKKANLMRGICLAFFILLLINPQNIFSISFQLSFAAMLTLAAFHELWTNSFIKKGEKTKLQKLFLYFLEMTLISTITQFFTTPFLIYYFGNIALYGFISNLIAIPLSSFVTMPLGFLSFFLMPFGFEKLALIPMAETVKWILEIAEFVTNLKYSYFIVPQISKASLAIAILGGLIFCLSNKLKIFGVLIFLLSFTSLIFLRHPDLIIDDKSKLFAINDNENGLVFSRDVRSEKKRQIWMQKVNEKEFKNFSDYSEESLIKSGIICDDDKCLLKIKNKKILILLKRMEVNEVCLGFDALINLTAKYSLPECNAQLKIDNIDLLKNGVYFIYIEGDKIKFKTAN